MPITLEQNGAINWIRLDGEVTIVQAAELKQLLVQTLKEGKNLRLDLAAATELDIPILQLLGRQLRINKNGRELFLHGAHTRGTSRRRYRSRSGRVSGLCGGYVTQCRVRAE